MYLANECPVHVLAWYEGGYRMSDGSEAGECGERPRRLSLSLLGVYARMFQTEIFATLVCANNCIERT